MFSFDIESVRCFAKSYYDFFNTLMINTLVPIYCSIVLLMAWRLEKWLRERNTASSRGKSLVNHFDDALRMMTDLITSGGDVGTVSDEKGHQANESDSQAPKEGPNVATETGGGDKGAEVKAGTAIDEDYGKKYFSLFVYLTYLVLPSVTTTIFAAFPWVDVNPSRLQHLNEPQKYLQADYSIAVGSSRHKNCVIWAIFMIFVYPIGVTVSFEYFLKCVLSNFSLQSFYLYLLRCHKEDIIMFKSIEEGVSSASLVLITFILSSMSFRIEASAGNQSTTRCFTKASFNANADIKKQC